MKKFVKIGIVLIIVLSLVIPIVKVTADTEEAEFLTATSNEITVSDKIELVLNLEEISYTNFTLTLSSENLDLSSLQLATDIEEEIETAEESVETEELEEIEEDVESDETNNTVAITISNSTLNQIIVQIDLPEEVVVGNIYEIIGTVQGNDSEEDQEIQNTVEIEIIESSLLEVETTDSTTNTENSVGSIASQEMSETDEVSDSTETENSKNFGTETETITNMSDMSNEDSSTTDMSSFNSKGDTSNSYSETSSSISNSVSSMSSVSSENTEKTVTYNGSDNCYLSELSITSYELNKTFSKDKTTYFVTVGSDVDSLEINATAEDDDATVCIYGNSSLSTGSNKILITVTAENGNTKTYKIIVTKES